MDNFKKADLSTLSKYVVLYFNSHGISVTPLKLQKVLYYIQAWHLVFFKKRNLFEELPQAWVNGPVYRTVYNKYKNRFYKDDTINALKDGDDAIELLNITKDKLKLDEKQHSLIEAILKSYGVLSSEKLVFMTHREDPWNIARKDYKPMQRCEEVISTDMMFDFYSKNRING
ncbi:DUF4065 domain-containing protein [Marinilabiliaceae bacterium JC017]|nr:DUF4065 domain-containing protein [Marinilabiliaceae bacterium JC017]